MIPTLGTNSYVKATTQWLYIIHIKVIPAKPQFQYILVIFIAWRFATN